MFENKKFTHTVGKYKKGTDDRKEIEEKCCSWSQTNEQVERSLGVVYCYIHATKVVLGQKHFLQIQIRVSE